MKKKRTSALVAKISVAATSLFLLLLLLLHFLKPEMSPSWRMISEYEIGRFGWLMQVAFFSLAGGTVLLALTLRSQVQSVAGYIGLVLLFVIAVGLVMGGIFITEPITTPRDEINSNDSRFLELSYNPFPDVEGNFKSFSSIFQRTRCQFHRKEFILSPPTARTVCLHL